MNKLRQYITPLTASVLALVVVLVPSFVFAQDDGSFIQELVWDVLIAITGSILYISGIVFDFAVNAFVIGFGDYYRNSGVGFAVDRTWVTIRDFVNLFFIFGLVYIGFKMILDSDDSNTRRWLVNLIIAALLINFSLFITKFVVDFSNQISIQIAQSGFCPGGTCPTGPSATGQPGAMKVDITAQILDLMGITSLFSLDDGNYGGYGWGYIFGTAIMFLVTSFVLIAGGFLLTIRFAMLNLFMVLSPFMFIGWILPPLSNLTSKYWDAFLRRAFFAPVYFLFLYFSLEILKAFQQSLSRAGGLGNSANIWNKADAATTLSTTQSTMPFFILICIFLVASIVISQKIGADGAGTAIKYGQIARQKLQRGVTRAGGAATVGAAGRLGRNTIGRAAYRYTNDDKAKDRASRSLVGKLAYKAAERGASATYDARNVGGVGKQLNLGEATKGGFKQRVEDAKKREEKFAGEKGLGFNDLDKPENKARVEAEQKRLQDEAIAARRTAEMDKEEFEKDILKTDEELTKAITDLTEEIKKDEEKLAKSVADNTITEKEKVESQASIDEKKKRLESKQNNMGVANANTAREKARLDLSLAQSNGATAQEQAEAREALQKAEAEYSKQVATERKAIEDNISEADKKFADAENEAKASIKYERQRAYIQQQKDSARLWRSVATLGLASGSGGLLGAATVGGAGAFGAGAIGGLSAAGSRSYVADEVANELDEKYGKGGVKAIGKEKKKKNMEALADALGNDKKDESKGDDDKKDDKKDDE